MLDIAKKYQNKEFILANDLQVSPFKHTTPRHKLLDFLLRHPKLFKARLRDSVDRMTHEQLLQDSGIPIQPLNELVDLKKQVTLSNFLSRDGNVSAFELMAIVSIVADIQPKTVLEIGTFDGNTTLQVALNCQEDAVIHTIDLPNDPTETAMPVWTADLKYALDKAKHIRKYVGTAMEANIVQHFGDSTAYDFSKFTDQGLIDFCFIDGGHSYDCVKSDTENTFKHLSKNGVVLWHDFAPTCPGNFAYLCELNKLYPLVHIAGTTIVMHKSSFEQS